MAEDIPEGTNVRRHEPYPWRVPIATEELEPEPTMPLPVRPPVLWQLVMITKYDLVLIEFSRDGTNWTKHLVSRPIGSPALPTPQRQKKSLVVVVVDAEKDKVLQDCVTTANVGRVDKAPPQQRPHSAPAETNAASSCDDAASQDVEPVPDVTEPAHDVRVPSEWKQRPRTNLQNQRSNALEVQVTDVPREEQSEDPTPQRSQC